jgi:chitodextrinase
MSIMKLPTTSEHLLTESRLDAVVWRIGWKEFQPNASTDAVTAPFEAGIAAAAANGKKAILELMFAPGDGDSSDQGSDKTNIPQWAKNQGMRYVIDPGVTNEFPVWWDPIYVGFAKNAITKLVGIYDSDTRVAGYNITGAAGVLPTSLAGEQTEALLDNFVAEGFVPAGTGGADEVDFQLPSQGYNYGLAVRDIITHWAISTVKPVLYNTRPLDPSKSTLANELEIDPIGLHTNIGIVDNGFRQCDGQDVLGRFVALQAAGHIVGWWGLAPNGFPTDTVASAVPCAGGGLDMKRVWFCLDDTAWDEQAGTLDAAHKVFYPTDVTKPTTPLLPVGIARSELQIDLSWVLSTDNVAVAGYKISRNGVLVGNSPTANFSDTPLDEATTYTYTVWAYDASGNKSSASTAITLSTLDVSIPSKPTALGATAVSGSEIDLTWVASTDNLAVTGYKVYRGGVQVGTSTSASYKNTGLAQATLYSYTVAAYDAAGNTSVQSGADDATTFDVSAPTVPTGLAGTPTSSSKIDLVWNASSDNVHVSGYDVYTGGVFLSSPKTASYTVSGLAEATSYTFTVRARDDAGNASAQCAAITAKTLDVSAPSKPAGLTATPKSSSQIDLAWSASTDNVGVTGYKIFRDGVQIATTTLRTYSSTGLAEARQYAFTVAAYDASANTSPQSQSAKATTLDVTAPSKPTNLQATVDSPTRIILSWSVSTDNLAVTGYRIYRNGVQIATKTSATYTDSGLARNTSYTYTVAAYDAAGNVSAQSTAVTAKTLP